MLQLSGLSVAYGPRRVIDCLDLALGQDEILMLVGPTGCGKTTLLQAIAGLIPIAAGEIRLGSWSATPSRPVPPERRDVGMVFQDFALFPHLTVEQNVAFRLEDPAPAHHWLRLLGLEPWRHARPGTLSGGQKQRVALARTLAHRPALVLLDEPLSNLDAALKDTLRWEVRDALKQAGVPALWVTHDQEEALSVGDRLGVLRDGRLEQLAAPERCFDAPATRFVARFLGEASFLPGRLCGERVHTSLGPVPALPVDGASGPVDLLLRPDDVALDRVASGGNGHVTWVRYEGGTRLYGVELDEGGEVRVRASHENPAARGDRVRVRAITRHPLAAFRRDPEREAH